LNDIPHHHQPRRGRAFRRLAADWWDPNGSSAMLHRLNPVRLKYLRERIDLYFGADEHDRRPLAGKRAADVGCGPGCWPSRWRAWVRR
jgi:2-polyprenyl-6-hydroxyphenyl methylase/3-demethylubiquinone-9 3-methyltransferase